MVRKVTKKNQKDKQEVIKNDLLFVQVRAIVRLLFNWFRRLVLPRSIQKLQVDTIRLKLLKVAAKLVRSARYLTFKLCSHCPYKNEFYETLEHICGLKQLE